MHVFKTFSLRCYVALLRIWRRRCFHGINAMILMPQIFNVTANENARYKRNELECQISTLKQRHISTLILFNKIECLFIVEVRRCFNLNLSAGKLLKFTREGHVRRQVITVIIYYFLITAIITSLGFRGGVQALGPNPPPLSRPQVYNAYHFKRIERE